MLLLYVFIWWYSSVSNRRVIVRVIAALVLLLLPIGEELWVAFNFAQACKDAGTFINRKVTVDGFYDATRNTHSGRPTADAARHFDSEGFRFYEMVLRDNKGGPNRVVHLERSSDEWRVSVLDRPTARYHYRWRSHIPIAPKVVKHESTVVDTQDETVIGRETIVGRYAPWFFVGLDAPQMQCYGRRDPEIRGSIHRHVLLPNKGADR